MVKDNDGQEGRKVLHFDKPLKIRNQAQLSHTIRDYRADSWPLRRPIAFLASLQNINQYSSARRNDREKSIWRPLVCPRSAAEAGKNRQKSERRLRTKNEPPRNRSCRDLCLIIFECQSKNAIARAVRGQRCGGGRS